MKNNSWLYIVLGFFSLVLIAGCVDTDFSNQTSHTEPQSSYSTYSDDYENDAPTLEIDSLQDNEEYETAPNGYYINVDGNSVPSPYYAPSAPSGASAQCNDGTYSFSQHRSGTCSGHGGVSIWY